MQTCATLHLHYLLTSCCPVPYLNSMEVTTQLQLHGPKMMCHHVDEQLTPQHARHGKACTLPGSIQLTSDFWRHLVVILHLDQLPETFLIFFSNLMLVPTH